jgi:ABC-type Mn2+/Zn2+ transport system ATPase subunit
VPQVKTFNSAFPARVADLIAANRKGRWPLRLDADVREEARAALAAVGGERLLDASLAGLSGGEIQRVYLARALVTAPAVLLLDEPTAGVDARGRAEFLDLLGGIADGNELAVVLVTHSANAVRRLARRAVYLHGRVRAWGPPDEVLKGEWDAGGAFSGHDHADRSFCEDE